MQPVRAGRHTAQSVKTVRVIVPYGAHLPRVLRYSSLTRISVVRVWRVAVSRDGEAQRGAAALPFQGRLQDSNSGEDKKEGSRKGKRNSDRRNC